MAVFIKEPRSQGWFGKNASCDDVMCHVLSHSLVDGPKWTNL